MIIFQIDYPNFDSSSNSDNRRPTVSSLLIFKKHTHTHTHTKKKKKIEKKEKCVKMSGFLGEKVQSVNALCPGFVVLQMAAVQATHEH